MAVATLSDRPVHKSWLESLLGLAAEVRPGEAVTVLLLASNGFLILCAYYVIRPIRSALLLPVRFALPGGGLITGPEIQSYSGAILAGLFLFIVPLYGSFASRVNRIRLINYMTLFFASNLVIFFLLGSAGVSTAVLGVPFFLWIGIFNLMVVAQFWSFANDIYTAEQGKRLFAIIGFGASIGAIVGPIITRSLIGRLGPFPMMLISAAILILCLALANVVHVRERGREARGAGARPAEQPLGTSGGFQLVLGQRYLLLLGLLTLAANFVNTNGNFILNETLAGWARGQVESGTAGGMSEGQIIGGYMAGTDFWQNVLVVSIQFFLVSRIFKYLGIGGALFVLPMIALTSYGLFAAAPILALIRIAKITENATDYSLQNTLRRALFLPTSREAKYKALQAVETFFWRAGDMLNALATLVIVQILGLGVRAFALVNLALVVVWLVIAFGLFRENRRLTADAEAAAA